MSPHTYTVRIGARDFAVEFVDDGHVRVDGTEYGFTVGQPGTGVYSVLLDGASYTFAVERTHGANRLLIDGSLCAVDVETERERLLKRHMFSDAATHHSLAVVAPMPSLVVRIAVTEGQVVELGQALLVLEAMKMENELKANRSGTVKKIHVECGKAVEKGEVLISIV